MGLIEFEVAVVDFLMADFIHRIFLAPAFKKLIWAVENKALGVACVFVCMNDTGWDYQEHWPVDSDDFYLFVSISWRFFSRIPEVDFEVRRAYETETIGLFIMFVGTPGDSRLGHGDISHDGMELAWDFIVAEKFGEPAALVFVDGKAFPNDAIDRAFFV
ncbi:MAG: hypothetical protein RL179_1055 [Planctomycetota bacterium]